MRRHKISVKWLISTSINQLDAVGEFPKQRTYAFCPTAFKELTKLKLDSPTVSNFAGGHYDIQD
jgi:hypothetical protein